MEISKNPAIRSDNDRFVYRVLFDLVASARNINPSEELGAFPMMEKVRIPSERFIQFETMAV